MSVFEFKIFGPENFRPKPDLVKTVSENFGS